MTQGVRSRRVQILWIVATLGLSALIVAELAHWLAHGIASESDDNPHCAVLILGFRAEKDGQPHPIQRARVKAGVAAFRRHQCDRIVVSGGPAGNRYVEAEVMAALVVEQGVGEERVFAEPRARNTWQNVEYSLPLLEGYERVWVTSNSLHAHRARRYFCRQAPTACDRVRIASRYEPFSELFGKVFMLAYELAAATRDQFFF
jgi:vancomycin permeability regulator SanA